MAERTFSMPERTFSIPERTFSIAGRTAVESVADFTVAEMVAAIGGRDMAGARQTLAMASLTTTMATTIITTISTTTISTTTISTTTTRITTTGTTPLQRSAALSVYLGGMAVTVFTFATEARRCSPAVGSPNRKSHRCERICG